MYLPILRVHFKKIYIYKKDKDQWMTDAYVIYIFFLIFFINHMLWVYSFELHRQVDANKMGTHNICLYKEVDKKYTGCNLKTTELLDCVLVGLCGVIRLNTLIFAWSANILLVLTGITFQWVWQNFFVFA